MAYDVFLSHASAGAGVSGPDPAAPYRAKLPVRDFFVPRAELDKVREILTRGAGSTIGITTALSGAGGFGKTALARVAGDEVGGVHFCISSCPDIAFGTSRVRTSRGCQG